MGDPVHPDDLARLDALRSEALLSGGASTGGYRISSGRRDWWIESRAFVSYDDDGRAQRMVGVNIDVTDRKRWEEHQDLLVAELDHRVKNVLATVAAVAKHTSEHSGSLIDFDRRILSMADAHALLSRSQSQNASLADLVRHELAPYCAHRRDQPSHCV
jgi:two-component sensor histidine kinase